MADEGKVATSDLPNPDEIDVATAEEVVRQAQKLIETQIAAANTVDQKIVLLLQQSVTLASAALAASGIAFSGGAGSWLPAWAGTAFLGTGVTALLAAYQAGIALTPSEVSRAPGLIPSTLWKTGFIDRGRVVFFGQIVGALERAIDVNTNLARKAGRNYRYTLFTLICAPLVGTAAAATHFAWAQRAWWPVPILLVILPATLFRLRRRS